MEVSERKDEGVCAREHAAALLWSGRRGSARSRPHSGRRESRPRGHGSARRGARGLGFLPSAHVGLSASWTPGAGGRDPAIRFCCPGAGALQAPYLPEESAGCDFEGKPGPRLPRGLPTSLPLDHPHRPRQAAPTLHPPRLPDAPFERPLVLPAFTPTPSHRVLTAAGCECGGPARRPGGPPRTRPRKVWLWPGPRRPPLGHLA